MSSGVRECFRARPGFVFGFVDYSALELCTLAQVNYTLFGHSEMREALNAGKDLHCLLAAQMLGCTYEEMVKRVSGGDKKATDLRQAAKAGNFGLGGGMGGAKMALTQRKVGLKLCLSMGLASVCGESKITEYKGRQYPPICGACIEAAETLKTAWLRTWPEMTDYFKLVSKETENGAGEIEQLVSGRIRGGCGFTDGANTRFQGLAADGAKRALWLLTRECYTDPGSVLWGSRPVVFVHDEIGTELREAVASEALARQEAIMVAGMREFVKDVEIKVEGALCRFWLKGAKVLKVGGKTVPVKPVVENERTVWIHDS